MFDFKELLDNALFTSLLECAVTLLITYALTRLIRLYMKKAEFRGIHHRFLVKTLIAIIWVIGGMVALSNIPGLSRLTRTMLAGSGIVAVIVGLAAQDSFGNLLSGLFISLFKPFEVGDRVKLVNSGITGYIEDMTLRHTIIRTFMNNSRVIIPNSTINSEIIENSSFQSAIASNFVDVSISYESDLELAIKLLANAIGSHELYLDQRTPAQIEAGAAKVGVSVTSLGESSVNLRAQMWTRTVDENFRACSDVRIRIMEDFRANGIEIPYNRVVILDGHRREKRIDLGQEEDDRRNIS